MTAPVVSSTNIACWHTFSALAEVGGTVAIPAAAITR
jgi:hypothetical protein